MIPWFLLGISFLLSLVLLWFFTRSRIARYVLDQPNARSLHQNPVPRIGGLAILLPVMLAQFYWLGISTVLVCLLMLTGISLLDDRFSLSASKRLFVHVLVAMMFVLDCGLISFNSLPTLSAWLVALLAVGCLVWMTNLYNFMDGSDGLAGGMAVFGFSAYAGLLINAGQHEFAVLSICVVLCSFAFLLFNFHPAKIFMGDSGSIPLGFLAGAIGLFGVLSAIWAWWFPMVVFAPFIVDASVTLIRRLLIGENIFQAHRSHYYQKVVQIGFGHRNTALVEYALMAGCSLLAVWINLVSPENYWYALSGLALVLLLLMQWVERRWSNYAKMPAAIHNEKIPKEPNARQ